MIHIHIGWMNFQHLRTTLDNWNIDQEGYQLKLFFDSFMNNMEKLRLKIYIFLF